MAEFFDVRVALVRSPCLALWLLCVHGVGLAAIAAVASALPWAILAVPAVGVSFWHAWQRHYRLEHPGAIVALSHRHGWMLDTFDGRRFAATLHGPQWVSRWLIVLAFRAEASRGVYRIVVLADQTDPGSFTRLIRTVRWMDASSLHQ